MSETHQLGGSGTVALSDLAHEPIATLLPATGLRSVLESACAEPGFTPRIGMQSDDLGALADLVTHRVGVAVLPESVARRAAGLATLRLERLALTRTMALVWPRRRSSAVGEALLRLSGVRDGAGSVRPV